MAIEQSPLRRARNRAVGFLIEAAQQLEVSPVLKYTALSLFACRFWPSLIRSQEHNSNIHWLLQPIQESNLQLFALISLWISSKIHNSKALMLKRLKAWGDKVITDQHFTKRDFSEAVLNFEIGNAKTSFMCLEELFYQFREVAQVGKHLNFEACMDLMDLLYEEETMMLHCSSSNLAASILVTCYLITVPKQKWEFPVLSWVEFSTACEEEEIMELVKYILTHVLRTRD
ncbi:hypothetical protein SAY86_004369 [Trapa natans]|uniref:Cyclin N-terminal domain-containing protein n=1 Tax=Trapa natans TaxID=22666 RepID=A0AAN7MFM4_TRANT|nr:hypothetical protein SAY86_004369 [Trapa natans]